MQVPQQEYLQVDTSNILFICGGAFDGLDKIIRTRTTDGGIGFNAAVSGKEDKKTLSALVQQVEPEDLIHFGLIPEFIGRLPVIATLEELDVDALVRILKEPYNALTKQYDALFEMEGVSIEFQDDGLMAIAKKAIKRQAGARGLRSIMEHILLDTMFDLPSLEDVETVIINEAVVSGECEPIVVLTNQKKQA